jgi:hypothetical protein
MRNHLGRLTTRGVAQKENVMFEKLVVSTSQRRRGRTAKFFVCTAFIYLSVVGVAFALSVFLATPKLADTAAAGPGPFVFPTGGARQKPPDRRQPEVAATKDLRSVEPLDRIISNLGNPRPPAIETATRRGPKSLGHSTYRRTTVDQYTRTARLDREKCIRNVILTHPDHRPTQASAPRARQSQTATCVINGSAGESD